MSNTRAYRSKIGQLPFAFRNELNHRIRDGRTGTELLTHINTSPEFKALRRRTKSKPVNAQNLSDWRDSGYKHWLTDQDRTKHIREITEFSQSIVTEAGGNPSEVGCHILAGQILTALSESDTPTEELVKAMTALRKEATASSKVKLQAKELQLKERQYDLSRDKFEVQTAELFLEWFQDKKAVAVATSNSSHEKKIKALRSFIREAINED